MDLSSKEEHIQLINKQKIMRVAIFGNNYKKENLSLLSTLFEMLEQKQAEVCIEKDFFRFIESQLNIIPKVDSLIEDDNFTADMAISIGGDGTFLKTAAHIGKKEIPIIGINTGRLGFLADIARTDIIEPFKQILNGNYAVEERTALQIDCGDIPKFKKYCTALNEIAVLKQDSSSMITIHAYVNGNLLVDYQADGLIVSTPTGSTAYSMSVGGPLVVPQAKVIILSPIASHSLTVRPLVITDDCELTLKVTSRTNSFLVALDGRSQLFDESATLQVKKADYKIKVIKQKNSSFFTTLKGKLMWGLDRRPSLK